jgi:HK97 family phage major capsid protein
MSNSQNLREQRAALIAEARKIIDTNPDTPETQASWDKVMSDVDKLDTEIQTTERQEHQSKLEASLAERKNESRSAPHRMASVMPENAEHRALAAWFARACDLRVNLPASDFDSCDRFFGSGKTLNLTLPSVVGEQRTGLVTTTGSSALLPTITLAEIEKWLKYFAPMRDWVSVRRTLNGDPLRWPTTDWNGATASNTQVAEVGTVNEYDGTFSDVTFNAYKTAEVVLMSKEFIEDNVLGDGIVSLLSELIGEVVGRAQQYYFEVGTGSSQPLGIVNAATGLNSPVATITSLSFDNIFDLLYAVDRAYQPDVNFFCSNSTLKQLQKVKDSQGRYLMASLINNVTNSVEETILGHPIRVLSNMSDFAASGSGSGGTPFLIAAPPRKFMIRDVRNLQISVNPYLYEGTGQVAIYGTMRSDSNYIGPARSIQYLDYRN